MNPTVSKAAATTAPRGTGQSWSRWRLLDPPLRFTAASLAETLDGGQAFRWHCSGSDVWTGQWDRFLARVRLAPDGFLQWSVPGTMVSGAPEAIRRYFAADRDFEAITDRLPWRSDPRLAAAIRAFPGLRLLDQPLGETLLAFLCSTAKRIDQIKLVLARLAERFGEEIHPDAHALPTWKTLAQRPESSLRLCGLGFRARHIKATALALKERPEWTDRIASLPYREARDWLTQLPGVGEKVADCTLLFGAGKREAFPVDVWILKTMRRRYGLQDWPKARVAHFGRIHFGHDAGLAQQYLFAHERQMASSGKNSP